MVGGEAHAICAVKKRPEIVAIRHGGDSTEVCGDAIYESISDMTFLFDQLDDMAFWSGLDTADVAEVRRTYLISERQGNVNPFVVDASLARRAYADYLAPTLDCTDPATAPSYAGGYVLNAAGTWARRAHGRSPSFGTQ